MGMSISYTVQTQPGARKGCHYIFLAWVSGLHKNIMGIRRSGQTCVSAHFDTYLFRTQYPSVLATLIYSNERLLDFSGKKRSRLCHVTNQLMRSNHHA